MDKAKRGTASMSGVLGETLRRERQEEQTQVAMQQLERTNTKPSNPKDGLGVLKLPLSLIPPTALALVSLAHYDGKGKYGAWNWRNHGVLASVYLDATERHLRAWQEGENEAADSGVHHLAHAICCLNIILDAEVNGKLIDDRPPSGEYGRLAAYLTPIVERLARRHAVRLTPKPRNFTIADTEECKKN